MIDIAFHLAKWHSHQDAHTHTIFMRLYSGSVMAYERETEILQREKMHTNRYNSLFKHFIKMNVHGNLRHKLRNAFIQPILS